MGKIKKEKSSKSSHDRKNKTEVPKKKKNAEKKKTVTDEGTRRYGYISAKSVITMAETAGFSGIQEDVAKNLAEDVTYRLRYIIQQCKKHMIHSKRSRLSCTDINEVLKMCDVPKIYGYMTEDNSLDFLYIKEADVFVLEDTFIDLPTLALSEFKVQQKSSFMATAKWLKPEEIMSTLKNKCDDVKNINLEAQNSLENFKQGHKALSLENQKPGSESTESETKIPTSLIKYYGITCNTILGHSDLKIIFQDLSTNTKILPIIPYLLNFITIALNKVVSERQVKRLLQTVEALSRNIAIDFSPYSATTRIINAMLLIVAIDKKPIKCNYSYNLRSYAARVLALIISQWCSRDEQKVSVLKKMGKILSDFKTSPKVHFGAITFLNAMGCEALHDCFFDILKQYLLYLEELKKLSNFMTGSEVALLEESILAAAASMYRNPNLSGEQLMGLDEYLYSYFGNTICSIWNSHLLYFEYLKSLQKDDFGEVQSDFKYPKILKYMNSRYKPKIKKLTVEHAFSLPKSRKRKNAHIIFKFAGAIPVPEVNLKRRRFDTRCSQFIAGKESEGHVVVAGKRTRTCRSLSNNKGMLQVGSIFSVL